MASILDLKCAGVISMDDPRNPDINSFISAQQSFGMMQGQYSTCCHKEKRIIGERPDNLQIKAQILTV